MNGPEGSELVVRGAAIYLPIAVVVALAIQARPDRRRWAAAVVASVWNLVALLVVNLVALRVGWWKFGADAAVVAGVPADLWMGWALLWGSAPALVPSRFRIAVAASLVAADLALMPLGQPVVVLGPSWLVGEAVAVATCLLPGLALAHATLRDRRLAMRVTMQMAAFTGLLFFVLPSMIFARTGESWGVLLARPRWHFVLAGLVLAPFGALAVQGVCEFARRGGTPLPLDPPPHLVRTGPYAYIANPMQLGATVLLAAWGLLLGSLAVVIAAAMAAVFSAGLAAWSEDQDLERRFGPAWSAYRTEVRTWLPRWRPFVEESAVAFAGSTCDPCREVGSFLDRRVRAGLDVRPAEQASRPLTRFTYEDEVGAASGIAGIGRALEHLNLAWAVASWIARLPGIEQVLQLITDAVGGGPRDLPSRPPVRPTNPVASRADGEAGTWHES